MSEHEMALRALWKLIYTWSPVLATGVYLLRILAKGEKECEERVQAIRMARREERKVA